MVRIYLDFHDWWVGYYRGDRHDYVCLLPCVVLRWARRRRPGPRFIPHEQAWIGFVPVLEDPEHPTVAEIQAAIPLYRQDEAGG